MEYREFGSSSISSASKVGTDTRIQEDHQSYLENSVVVWFDVDFNEENFAESRIRLQEVTNHIQTFTNPDSCINYIINIRDERVFLILSRSNTEQFLLLAYELPNIHSIYLFDTDGSSSNQMHKIKGVFNNIGALSEKLKMNINRLETEIMGFEILENQPSLSLNFDESNKQKAVFMYSQLLKEIFLEMKDDDDDSIPELIHMLRVEYNDNRAQLRFIDEFEHNYNRNQAILWYTRDGPLYKVVNKALRTQNIDVLYKMRTFLRHVHEQLLECYHIQKEKNSMRTIKLYRGQKMSNAEFEKIKRNSGGLLSVSNFFSTTENQELVLTFSGASNDEEKAVLMIIEVNWMNESIVSPFASVESLSHFGEAEKEWIFSMGTVFRITHVQTMSDQIECIHLKITDKHDEQLSIMTEHLRKTIQLKEIDLKLSLATLLLRIGQHSKAAEFYQMKLQSEKHWSNCAKILMNMGVIAGHMYDQKKALDYYQQALNICHHEGKVSDDDIILAEIYTNIGTTYRQKGDKELALQYYRHSLDIQLKKTETNYNQPLFILTSDNMAHLLQEQGLYDEALLRYKELLTYIMKTFPSIDPYIGKVQKRISWIFLEQGRFEEALQNIKRSFDIQMASLPEDHIDIAVTYNTLATISVRQEKYEDALSYYDCALSIYLKHFPADHPVLSVIYNNIGTVYRKQRKYNQAFEMIWKAFHIDSAALTSNHPDFASTCTNMCLILTDLRRYDEAYIYCNQAIDINNANLPPEHPSFITLYNQLAYIQSKRDAYEEAVQASTKSMNICHSLFGPKHPDSIEARIRLSMFLLKCSRFEEALAYAVKTVELSIEAFGMAHPISHKCQRAIEFICSQNP